LPGGAEWTYEYDPFGRRVRKRGPSRETEFVWDGDVVLHELNSADGGEPTRTDWEYHPRGHSPVAKVEGRRQYLFVNDQLGTPRELVTPSGSVVWAAQWTTFGEPRVESPRDVDCPVRYPGQWFDEETGLHYNRLRYYDPQTGRYLSPDPLGLLGGLNLYQYTRCPVNWIDPLGLQDTLPLDGWRYSQTTAGGKDGVRYDAIRPSMEKGWDPTKPPVDVVRLPPENGGHLVGFDNTRPLIGQELGWHEIPVNIHGFNEPIDRSAITPHDEAWFAKMRSKGAQLSDPPTWGELLKIRTEGNGLPLEGTTERPKVVRKCPK
jgi:RHS repeat-associated protein